MPIAPHRSGHTAPARCFPRDRKSVEPMAARVEFGRVQATHRSLHHLVAKADRPDEAITDRRAPAGD